MERNERRIQIYEALLSLIEEKPTIDKISIADIANKIDIGKSTLYEYFDTKEQIVFETFKYTSEIFLDNLAKIPLNDFKESVLEFMKIFYDFQKKAKKFCLSFNTNILFEEGDFKNKFIAEVAKIRSIAVVLVENIFKLGFEKGCISKYPFDSFGVTFIETTVIHMISVFDVKADLLKMDWKTYSETLYKTILIMLQ